MIARHRQSLGGLRRLVARELDVGEAARRDDLGDGAWRLVHEDADRPRARRERTGDRARLLDGDPPAARREDESEEVGARLDGRARRLDVAEAADLDYQSSSSLTFPSTSPDFTSASPTSIASTPRSRRRRTSSRVWIPLSDTTSRSRGDERAQPGGRLQRDVEGPEVAVVDPDEPGAGRERALDLALVVDLHERGHAEVLGEVAETSQRWTGQDRRDEQHRVGAGRSRLEHLVGVEDEVLAETG